MEMLGIEQAALTVVLILAWLRGGEPERFVATVLATASWLDLLNHALLGPPAWFTVNPGHLVLDGWALLVLGWVALAANRGWTLGVAAAQVVIVVAHLAKFHDVGMARRAYWAMTEPPFMLQLAIVAVGTTAHWRRERVIGHYPGWRRLTGVPS